MDIRYIQTTRGFVSLLRGGLAQPPKGLSWKLSITTEVSFCLEAAKETLERNENPETFNTGQGSQSLKRALPVGSIKYEEVYLRAYDSVQEARTFLGKYIEFYNRTRPPPA